MKSRGIVLKYKQMQAKEAQEKLNKEQYAEYVEKIWQECSQEKLQQFFLDVRNAYNMHAHDHPNALCPVRQILGMRQLDLIYNLLPDYDPATFKADCSCGCECKRAETK